MKKWMSLSERIYHCEVCEIVRDRDQNSTISIMKRVLSCNALWTDYRYFLNCIDNQRYPVNDKTKIPLHLVGDGFSELVGSPLL
ncbi:MAG: hypothetical protein ACFFFH_19040, partial [Candidatus Thorarchaeota archaeon]